MNPTLAGEATETDLLDTIIAVAHQFGWHVHHDRPARTGKGWRTPVQGNKGFPDLVLARDGHVIIAELKTEKGKLTGEQATWLAHLGMGEYGREVYVWRPSDLPAITDRLR